MGLNPHRTRVPRKSDVVFVVAAIALAVALVVWAFVG
jgi:hypothetical protein